VRPIDRVVERLKDARVHNGYLMALCPAHDDREPSLSLKEGDDGRVLIKCHAGCTTENIVEAIGLEMHDLFDEKEGGASARCLAAGQALARHSRD
jgi:putative DNA primase/helicase